MSPTVLPHMTSRQSALIGATDEELADIRLFRERVEKLAKAQAKYQGIPISTFDRDQDSWETVFAANTPDFDDIINLAVKFRFFYADKEPTQLEKIAKKFVAEPMTNWRRAILIEFWIGIGQL